MAVRCDDPALEPHHAQLEVGPAGIRVIQLAGRMPLVIDGRPLDAGGGHVATQSLIEIGHSTLLVRCGEPEGHRRAHLRGDALVRGPRRVPVWAPAPLTPPAGVEPSRSVPGGLLPALLAMAGSGVLALVTHQPMFLLFGAMGGLLALGSWVAQRVGRARGTRRAQRQQTSSLGDFRLAEARLRDEFVEHLRRSTSTTVEALATVRHLDERLWARRATHADAFAVSLGTGELLWHAPLTERPLTHGDELLEPVASTPLRDQPIVVDLGPGVRVAVCGTPADTAGVARAVLVQLVANCGPADLRLVVVSNEPAAWRWVTGVPHAVAPDGACCVVTPDELGGILSAVAAGGDRAGTPHVVIVTDAPELLAARTSPLRRGVSGDLGPALIALVPAGAGVPHVCNAVLSMVPAATTSSGRAGRWVDDAASSALPVGIRVAALGRRAATRAVTALHVLSDPDDPSGASAGLPSSVSLLALLAGDDGPITSAGIAARWLAAGIDPHPRTPLGMAADGLVDLDLVRDGPHGLFAGTTGSGKSELLRSLVAGMAAGASPDHLTFVLVDYKGGATFDACAALPHVVGIVTDLDDQLADRALRSLDAELRRRETLLRDHGAGDLTALRDANPHVTLPRLVVVIDEFAALVAEQPTFLSALVGIAQRGRSLGVHLLLATQRPNGVISDDIRANTNIRLALRLHDGADALDVVGDLAPTLIPRRVAGRAVLRLGPEEHVTFQAARCTGTAPSELDVIVHAIRDAASIIGVAAPRGPWRPALPTELDADAVAALLADAAAAADAPDAADGTSDVPADRDPSDAGMADVGSRGIDTGQPLGLVDDPDRQAVHALTWHPGRGHLLIAGALGSGVTSTLVTLAGHVLDTDVGAHLYVVDGKGDDALLGLADHRRCAGVVRLHERERLLRLLRRLAAVVEQRAASGGRGTGRQIVLIVDGFTDVRAQLDELATVEELEALDRIIAAGAGVGVCAMLAVEQAGAVPSAILARCPQRWVLHLTDRHDASAWGLTSSTVPGPIPGRVAIGDGLHAQLVRPVRPARLHVAGATRRVEPDDAGPDDAGPDDAEPIEVLAATVAATASDGGRCDRDGTTWLPVGPAFAGGEQAALAVPDGEQVLILGPARSGRTTALARLVVAWRAAYPAAWAGVLLPRRTATALARTHTDLAALLDDVPRSGPALLAIDDADVVDDPGGALAALLATRRPGLLVVATGKPEVLRQTYGHWTAVVRRSRLGLVLTACNDIDGDLLGASLPRRRPVPARPGLAWLCDNGDVRLVQVAVDDLVDDLVHHAGDPRDDGVGEAAVERDVGNATADAAAGATAAITARATAGDLADAHRRFNATT